MSASRLHLLIRRSAFACVAAMASAAIVAPALAQRSSAPPYVERPSGSIEKTAPMPPFVAGKEKDVQPRDFLAKVKASADYEKQASDLALQRSRVPDVQAIARRLREHGKIASAAVDAAETKVGAPHVKTPKLSDMRSQNLEQLQRLKDPNFSTRYVKAMVSLYQQWRQDLEFAARQDADNAAKRLATQMLPRARDNLAALQTVEMTRR